jgi:hypothetical protein
VGGGCDPLRGVDSRRACSNPRTVGEGAALVPIGKCAYSNSAHRGFGGTGGVAREAGSSEGHRERRSSKRLEVMVYRQGQVHAIQSGDGGAGES